VLEIFRPVKNIGHEEGLPKEQLINCPILMKAIQLEKPRSFRVIDAAEPPAPGPRRRARAHPSNRYLRH